MGVDINLISDKVEKCRCIQCGSSYERKMDPIYVGGMTHNNATMARMASLYQVFWHPEKINVVFAKDAIPYLEVGLNTLKINKEQIKAVEPSNGWGSYEDLMFNTERYLKACKEHPDYKINVSI